MCICDSCDSRARSGHFLSFISNRQPNAASARYAQGTLATVCLPALFTLSVMIAYAWANTGSPNDQEQAAAEDLSAAPDQGAVGSGGCQLGAGATRPGRVELEVLALEALCRACRAVWALVLRVLRPEVKDGAAAAVTVISLCSVAFVALPTFRALEDAERTYQVPLLFSSFFLLS